MMTVEKWNTKRLDEVGEIFSGSTPSTTNQSFWDGEIVWITPSDLSRLNSPYLHESSKKITDKGLQSCSVHVLPLGSIVISSRAPIGYVAIPTVNFCTNQGCKSIKLKSSYDSEFTYYNINFHIEKNVGEGTTFAEISKAALSKIKIPFPESKQVQTKIAKILSTLDQAIEQTEAIIAKQQRIKTGLMQDLLTKGIDENGNIRSEATHEFKDSPLGLIPMEWEVAPLRSFISFLSYGFTNPMPEALDGPYMITAANVQGGKIDYYGCRKTERAAFDSLLTAKSRPLIGDVLITKDGTLGRVAVVDRIDVCINQSVAVLRFRENLSNLFGAMLLESPMYQALILADAGGSTIKHIYISKLDKMLLAIPANVSEQSNILNVLAEQTQAIAASQRELDKLSRMKTGLMHDLLTGKVRVTDTQNSTLTPESL